MCLTFAMSGAILHQKKSLTGMSKNKDTFFIGQELTLYHTKYIETSIFGIFDFGIGLEFGIRLLTLLITN